MFGFELSIGPKVWHHSTSTASVPVVTIQITRREVRTHCDHISMTAALIHQSGTPSNTALQMRKTAAIDHHTTVSTSNSTRGMVHKKLQLSVKAKTRSFGQTFGHGGSWEKNELFLQSVGKRRRYMRRGSKTPCMLRALCAVEFDIPMSISSDARAMECDSLNSSTTSLTTTASFSSLPQLPESVVLEDSSKCLSASIPSKKFLPDLLHPENIDMEDREHGRDLMRARRTTISLLASALDLCDIRGESKQCNRNE